MIQMIAGPEPTRLRAGFTATRKIGGAVVRNRCKRRLREAARQLLPLHGVAGHDYVFVARSSLPARPWERLLDDVKTALISLAAPEPGPAPPRGSDLPPSSSRPGAKARPRS